MLWVAGREIATDAEGYLREPGLWDEAVAAAIAEAEGLVLGEDHWQVLRYVRRYYEEFKTSPAMRPLVKYLGQHLGPEKGNSLFLAGLFPGGAAKQATKLAGLPKPTRCI
ncbi:MAG: TusE/DsrC/DsvC family sulfur relay protein [Gammaproteobacteria bacterium]|nr:TusE/DsrC/DsvC family sulfur relay protein [Gammaproteobacteria bacterium]